jgi:AraC-like DNA-binding protein/ferredoxin
MIDDKKRVKERVRAVLKDIDLFAGYGAVYHAVDGNSPPVAGKALCRLCQACVEHCSVGSFCRHEAISGGYQSFVEGEVYYGRCWLGLYFLVIPVVSKNGNVIGVIEIGGLLPPGGLQQKQHIMMATLNAVSRDDNLTSFINSFQGLEEMPHIDIENLKIFLREAMFSSGLLDSKLFDANNAAWKQQVRLSQVVQKNKDVPLDQRRRSILELADKLLISLSLKDEGDVRKSIDNILSIAIGSDGGDWESLDIRSVKAFLFPVLSVLSMDSLLRKEKWSLVMVQHTRRVDEMAAIETAKELCFWFESMILNMLSLSPETDSKHRELLSERIIAYFYKHYSENIYMSSVAKHLGASPSSVMHKVKKETGCTFSQLLNEIRIKEAKRLLTFTNLSLSEISFRCGFKDQSYFTKVFSRYVNITPREFRKMLRIEMNSN